jgi:hypothetical protein
MQENSQTFQFIIGILSNYVHIGKAYSLVHPCMPPPMLLSCILSTYHVVSYFYVVRFLWINETQDRRHAIGSQPPASCWRRR